MGGDLDYSRAIEIDDGIYWLGWTEENSAFRSNPYLIDDGEDVVLLEPGSVPHFSIFYKKLESVVEPERVNYIFVSHQDPDLCTGIPLLEERLGKTFTILTHTRTTFLLPFYGIKSRYYAVDMHGWKLKLKSGRELKFIFMPYCHFPGMTIMYDTKSRILFSGDLFGGLSYNWSLYADEWYIEAMKAFHEHYMPSKEILRHNMSKLEKLDIKMIAPQHGSIIREDVQKYIEALKNLDCGEYMLLGEE